MTTITRTFEFLTAGFPHGAYQSQGFNQPELRPPSVIGELRWWFDALFARQAEEDKMFGGLKLPQPGGKTGPGASRIITRLTPVETIRTLPTKFIPHKKNEGAQKHAICPGNRYNLFLTSRREGITDIEKQRLERIVDAWLLLGAVGQRANRGAGSLWSADAPTTEQSFTAKARTLLTGSKLSFAILGDAYPDEQTLRDTAGDFIDGPTRREYRFGRETEVTETWWPFGAAEVRKPSPLKLRAAKLGGQLRLIAVWDGRHHTPDNLKKGVLELAKTKLIGELLTAALPRLAIP